MSNVKRSTYQKVVEQNKKLLSDIKTLTGDITAKRIQLVIKWRDFFREEEEFNQMLKTLTGAVTGKGVPHHPINKLKEN